MGTWLIAEDDEVDANCLEVPVSPTVANLRQRRNLNTSCRIEDGGPKQQSFKSNFLWSHSLPPARGIPAMIFSCLGR